MSQLTPPGWLLVVSGICYTVFYTFFGSAIFGGSVPNVDASTGGFAPYLDAVKGIWDFITFGAFNPQIEIPVFVSAFLFLVCTIPWFFVVAALVAKGLEAIGSWIPFTLVLLGVLLLVPGVSAQAGSEVDFQPDASQDGAWRLGTSLRFCSTQAMAAGNLFNLTYPSGLVREIVPDSEACGSVRLNQTGTWTLRFSDDPIATTKEIRWEVFDPDASRDFWIQAAIYGGFLVLGVALGWYVLGGMSGIGLASHFVFQNLAWPFGAGLVALVVIALLEWVADHGEK